MPRLFRRTATAAVAATALVALFATPALAHVTVNSPNAVAGGYATVNVKVPTESDTASTVGVKVQLPEDHPFASVSVKPHPGWTYTASKTTLDKPIDSHGEQITEAVSTIEWKADGPGIAPGEYDEFSLSVGPLPDDADSLTFKAIQTYSDGTEVSWIEEAADGADEPEHPAPLLTVAPASGDDHGADAAGGASGSDTDSAAAESTDDDGGSGTTIALILGGAGLLVAVVALWLALSRRRTAD